MAIIRTKSLSNSGKLLSSAANLFGADCFALFLNKTETWEQAQQLKQYGVVNFDDETAMICWRMNDDGTTTRTYLCDNEYYMSSNIRTYDSDGKLIGRIVTANHE